MIDKWAVSEAITEGRALRQFNHALVLDKHNCDIWVVFRCAYKYVNDDNIVDLSCHIKAKTGKEFYKCSVEEIIDVAREIIGQ